MEPVAGVLGVFIVIAVVIAIRLIAGSLNHGRIREYIENKGGEIVEIQWEPFGPGWFGEKSDAIYRIKYLDRDGNEHLAYCKTSMFTGVYLTEDKIVRQKRQENQPQENPSNGPLSLEEENRRLREEIRRLKREQEDYR